MKIISLSYKNRKTGWNIQDVSFNNLTLLVGASGVGKTLILNAIIDLTKIVKGQSLNAIEWTIKFRQDQYTYQWEGAFSVIKEENIIDFFSELSVPVEYEKLVRISDREELLINRDNNSLLFKGRKTVKLEADKSAIALLKEEDDISPVFKGFRQVYLLDNVMRHGIRIPFNLSEESINIDLEILKSKNQMDPLDRLFILYTHNYMEFGMIKNSFISIFPFVEDLKFTLGSWLNNRTYPVLQLKEKNVDQWIPEYRISSGMKSTLSHLTTMTLSQKGDVILIDEFENSLGINCIEEVADLVINPDYDLQFVITSHHPYIINNIDYSKWKIVARNGSNVSVHSAKDFHIGNHSRHDAFMQLIQTSVFKSGVL